MSTPIRVRWTSQGLLIPRDALQDMGEVEVLRDERRIVIQPRALPPDQERLSVIQALQRDGLWVNMDAPPLMPPVTEEERAQLAHKLGQGRSLSEILFEERQNAW